MKKGLLLFCVVVLFGCSYQQNYLESPGAFIKDPHFTDYKEKRDDLELEYVRKEITYAEYMERRDQLDAIYDRQVQERNEKIMSPE